MENCLVLLAVSEDLECVSTYSDELLKYCLSCEIILEKVIEVWEEGNYRISLEDLQCSVIDKIYDILDDCDSSRFISENKWPEVIKAVIVVTHYFYQRIIEPIESLIKNRAFRSIKNVVLQPHHVYVEDISNLLDAEDILARISFKR